MAQIVFLIYTLIYRHQILFHIQENIHYIDNLPQCSDLHSLLFADDSTLTEIGEIVLNSIQKKHVKLRNVLISERCCGSQLE
jgi:hypothetical protein